MGEQQRNGRRTKMGHKTKLNQNDRRMSDEDTDRSTESGKQKVSGDGSVKRNEPRCATGQNRGDYRTERQWKIDDSETDRRVDAARSRYCDCRWREGQPPDLTQGGISP